MGLDMFLLKRVKDPEYEDVGYWRKANAIHGWFVENVQNGIDDCKEYRVTKEQLTELLELCKQVKVASKLIDGQVHNGTKFSPEKGREEIIEEGKVIEDSTVAESLLPTTSGFFFGSYDYDEYYLSDINETIEILEIALRMPDDTQFYYQSSW